MVSSKLAECSDGNGLLLGLLGFVLRGARFALYPIELWLSGEADAEAGAQAQAEAGQGGGEGNGNFSASTCA